MHVTTTDNSTIVHSLEKQEAIFNHKALPYHRDTSQQILYSHPKKGNTEVRI